MKPGRVKEEGLNQHEHSDPRLVEEQFEKEESITARAYKRSKGKGEEEAEREADAASFEQRQARYRALAEEELRIRTYNMQVAGSATATSGSVLKKARGLSSLARWTGLGVAGILHLIQLVFAVISLFAMGLLAFTQTTWLGKSVSWVADIANKVVSFLTGIEQLFSLEDLTMGAWAVATFIALITFFGFLLWFYITGVNVFRTTISILITAVCFALAIIPIANLFPWLVLWIIYINVTALFSDVKSLTGSS